MQVDGAATPTYAPGDTPAAGATPKRGRSRWDETPAGQAFLGATPSATPSATPGPGATPLMGAGMNPGATPVGGMGMATPTPGQLAQSTQSGAMTPEQFQVRLSSSDCNF